MLAWIVFTVLKLHAASQSTGNVERWLSSSAPDRYAALRFMVEHEDFSFVSEEPGFELHVYKRLRQARLRIFRDYLNGLIYDYNRLHHSARLLAAGANRDQTELLSRLVRLRLHFWVAIGRAEFNYYMCCLGVRTLPVRALLFRLEQLRYQVSEIAGFQAG